MLVRVADFVAARGHDPEALCRSAGTTLGALRAPDARVPYALAEALGDRAVELTRDANFGLHLAQDVRDADLSDAGELGRLIVRLTDESDDAEAFNAYVEANCGVSLRTSPTSTTPGPTAPTTSAAG